MNVFDKKNAVDLDLQLEETGEDIDFITSGFRDMKSTSNGDGA
jgi:hypothetical protein